MIVFPQRHARAHATSTYEPQTNRGKALSESHRAAAATDTVVNVTAHQEEVSAPTCLWAKIQVTKGPNNKSSSV